MTPSPWPPSEAGAPVRTGNLSANRLTFFERSWEVDHRIVADDLMEHVALVAALRAWIEPFLRRRARLRCTWPTWPAATSPPWRPCWAPCR